MENLYMKKYDEIILKDFPEAKRLINSGLISAKKKETYCIIKRFRELDQQFDRKRKGCKIKKEVIDKLSDEFPKSPESIYKCVRSELF